MSDQYDRVLIRLSTAEDDKLSPILTKLLPLVFDELLTQTDPGLRAKLVNVLNHALTRAKGNAAITLPAQSILERWFAPGLATTPNGPFFRNLSMIFLDLGVPRLQPQEQINLALYALENFGKLLPGLDRIVVFLTCIPGLGQIAAEGHRKDQVPRCLQLLRNLTDNSVAFFQSAIEFLLIPCGSTEAASIGGLPSASWSHWKSRLKSKSAAEMVALKCTVLRWLSSLGAEPPAFMVYLPSLVASVENYDAVCNMAESNCKRLDLELDMDNDVDLLGRLICLGLTSAPPGQENAAGSLKVETKVSVPAKLRHKVLVLLQRSRGIGPALVAHVVHLIRQSLRESEQVQQSALQLALVLSETVDPENLVETSEKILAEIEAVFWPGGGVIAMGTATPLAFKTFGSFARQLAERPSGEGRALALQCAPKMLRLLAANENAAQDILEALSGLVACLCGSDESERKDFLPLLDKLVTAPRAVVRREVLRWSSALFPASAPEGRYYALRLLGDKDADLAKAAESSLAAGGNEAPPFLAMCKFLAFRALGDVDPAERLLVQEKVLASAGMPPLAAGFTWDDLARALSFLIKLAEAEGLEAAVEDSKSGMPAAKKPRLAGEGAAGAAVFLVMLDYILSTAIEGKPFTVTDEIVDGVTCLELALRGLHLAAALSKGHDVLGAVIKRAEALLLGGSSCLRGGRNGNKMRRLGARVLGALAKQTPGTATVWLQQLDASLGDASPEKRAAAALSVCELLREGVTTAEPAKMCQKVLSFLIAPQIDPDSAALTAACDGLRRLSERKPLVWEALQEGGKEILFDRVYGLSTPMMDADSVEVGTSTADLIYASWRFLGKLAAWDGDGSKLCLEKLIAIGRRNVSEEALAAMGLALCAVISDPLAPQGEIAASRAAELLRRLLQMAGDEEASDKAGEVTDAADAEDGAASLARKRVLAAERDGEQRCGVVWLATLMRRMSQQQLPLPADLVTSLSRAFVRSFSGLSMFVADCSLKSLCNLYRLVTAETRGEFLKALFSSISNRTVVSNMFVGTPDTQARKEEKDSKETGGPNSWKIAAKERVDLVKDLMFLARELQHPALFIGLLDQPSGSVWTGEIMREALDLQAPCLGELESTVCPVSLRPKLYTYLFHPNAQLRQAVVAVVANYFSCESPQSLTSKHPEEWPLLAKSVLGALGNSRVATREAGIHAAQALFRGRVWCEMAIIFEELWTITVKLMDDMEQRVQAVVKPFVRMMRNLTLRLCDVKVTARKDVETAMSEIVPLLLRFCERYKHAQPVCFEIMRELIKGATGTTLLEPHVQNLVPPLLVSLSMMENDALQYYQFHISAASEEKGKELEAARISNSRDSESMKLIKQLIPFISNEVANGLAPRTRDLLHRGVGANTRVGVCDFWVAVCAERPNSVETGGAVASSMLRSVAGALLDPSREVRGAAASCFASFARRNPPQELTKVVFERLLKQDQEFRTDDVQRNSYRISLSRALWEVCRRCDDSMIESELKSAIASKAFSLRWSSEAEVKTGWESLWGELCPTTAGGVQRYRSAICAELADAFAESVSRADKVSAAKAVSGLAAQLEKVDPRPCFAEDSSIQCLLASLKAAVQTLPTFDGSGNLVRALADLAAVSYRRKRGEEAAGVNEDVTGISLILSFCSKGPLAERAAVAQAYLEVTAATRLWPPLADAERHYKEAALYVDQLQQEVEQEEREPGQAPPKIHRGKGSSPAEELLSSTLDFWATALQQCRREIEDEGDLEPPEGELAAFTGASLAEFKTGSLTLRLSIIRLWKHVFKHFAQEQLSLQALSDEHFGRIVWAIQDASWDPRSERLRRPALELAASLAEDTAQKKALLRGLHAEAALASAESAGAAAARAVPLTAWLERIDSVTAEQCSKEVAVLRALSD